jgi:hypothetical protein
MVRQSYTAVVERNKVWTGTFATEPYEAAWATEAVIFIRTLEPAEAATDLTAQVQISPDGMHWCNEGASCAISSQPGVTFCRVTNFGGWLRLAGDIPADGQVKVIVYIALKS